VRVVTGSYAGVSGPVTGVATEPAYLDVALAGNGRFAHELPIAHTAFAYVYEGTVKIGDTQVRRGELAVLSDGDQVVAAADGGPGKFILVAGRPLKEPIVQYGPFVMNTREEIVQAVEDFQSGKF
jgi:redox-sensitive bicupin YhaK (pirin superfamily)